MTQVYPKNTYIVVRKFNSATKRLDGFEHTKRTFERGKVMEIGDNVTEVNEGNIILYSTENVTKLEKNLYIMSETSVLAKKRS